MPLTRDEINTLADTHYDSYDDKADRLFGLLVHVGRAYVQQLKEDNPPSLDDPQSFAPATLAGISYITAACNGLAENLELEFGESPDSKHFPPSDPSSW